MFDIFFFFSSRRRHTRLQGDWSSDVCSSDLLRIKKPGRAQRRPEQAPRMSAPASWRLRGGGRGAGRGRGEISGGGGSFKKKKKKKKRWSMLEKKIMRSLVQHYSNQAYVRICM